mmetsp:Transcript_21728/g.37033  ORF Transcript_21728/g.37033 Transcript_21728/m.37033 type:complete len:256 (-) Transcript_21728:547-1314(-)|eukprot:CAMPEP_0119108840 /NCGR_PEP_ID=MMETSP1180-20130426/15717_1 /TAXON_ID=3052 ORGANISM="Chlamydomonas cf sp, Strain CCMP681" /NCGR_SAMPLE_ID=MMETSP1180 /ASSEMBLY_ACC=CAM_ASM_000741 /LENGTH=255 /DNA_ID=CAMNT_0007094503 /DNA_START=179 /DNA_END=946 /DNA_ORIENTATION=+
MGLIDRMFGSGKPKDSRKEDAGPSQPHEQPASAPQAAAQPELHRDSSTPSFGPPSVDPQSLSPGQGVPGLMTGLSTASTPTSRFYDPYEGLSAAAGKKHSFRLPEQSEFVFEEEAASKRRGWSENLQFYTGLGYLSGGIAGVSAGLYTYATVKPEIPLTTFKLKANRVLNLAGSRAKPFSNSTAILGFFFSCTESYLGSLEVPGMPEAGNTMAAGAIAGAIFRSPRGPRQAIAAAAVGAVGGVTLAGLRTVFPSL